jgi:hypothetical protein
VGLLGLLQCAQRGALPAAWLGGDSATALR